MSFMIKKNCIHTNYQKDPLPEINTTYSFNYFTKYLSDEKEIAEVYVKKSDKKIRIGWIIPVISMISIDHDFFENKYFIKHVYEYYKSMTHEELDENLYILIASERLLNEAGISSIHEISLDLIPYGIYPYNENIICQYEKKNRSKIKDKVILEKTFDIYKSKGFLKHFIYEVLPEERSPYARFLHCYQFFEIAMESIFYFKINEKKQKKNHLGNIRESINELSSERKLISILYTLVDINQVDPELNNASRSIFLENKEDSYYSSTPIADLIYDIRNTLVHNHYRFNLTHTLPIYCDYLENFTIRIIKYFFENKNNHPDFEKNFFS